MPRRLLSSRTFGLMGKPRPGQRATSLPPLPGFETFRAANSATAPPLLSSAGQSTANSSTAPPLLLSAVQSTAGGSGRSGSVLSFITTTPSIRQTTNTATTPSSIRNNDLSTPSSITTEGGRREEAGRQLICVVKKGKRFVCQPFPLCGSVRILITRMLMVRKGGSVSGVV
jgi:hypothetical protein